MYIPAKWLIISLLICLAPTVLAAQDNICPQIVEQALSTADSFCASTGRNQACYGNILLTAQPQPDVTEFHFDTSGDIENVANIQQMTLSPMDVTSGNWGVVVMRLQANLPDTLPGQNVTFLLFGDVQVTNAVSGDNAAELTPMQAFYLKTGGGDAQCAEAPESGMLVQTPQGVGQVQFSVNGVDVQMGSTVFFQADARHGMRVSTLEGAAYVEVDGSQQVIVPGTSVTVPMTEDANAPGLLKPSGSPAIPDSYADHFPALENLPFGLLKRQIEVAPGLTLVELRTLRQQIQSHRWNKQPLCGEDPLPDCNENGKGNGNGNANHGQGNGNAGGNGNSNAGGNGNGNAGSNANDDKGNNGNSDNNGGGNSGGGGGDNGGGNNGEGGGDNGGGNAGGGGNGNGNGGGKGG